MINWQALTVFILVFTAVTMLGFWAARWRAGDLNHLQEWGLAGRRFGTVISWFLLGGDIYTAYSFISIPGLIFATGAAGFFFAPTQALQFLVFFLIMPRLWTVARHRGYVTAADFVRERFGSSPLALLIAITGVLAIMPYIALQIYGMEVCLAMMGVPLEAALFIAFVILAGYTYVSGLRAPAMIAMVKDISIWTVVLIAFIYLLTKLGGFSHLFAAAAPSKLILQPTQYSAYVTLMLGTATSLFLYPHTLTGVLSTNSSKVLKRNAMLLPAYSILLSLIGLLGYVAIAIGIKPSAPYGTNGVIPALFTRTSLFPSWFAGFALAAIAISALAPAAIMSIGAANLFTRNIYREYIRPKCSEHEETHAAKIFSLAVKVGALVFILFLPTTFSINFQLFSNIWILQTLPAVFIGLYTNWFHPRALLIGWLAGMVIGTWLPWTQHFASSVYPFSFFGVTIPLYVAIPALLVNLSLAVLLTLVFRAIGVASGRDTTTSADFETRPVSGSRPKVMLPQTAGIVPGQYERQSTESRQQVNR